MAAKPVADWSVDDVVAMLHQLSLGHVAEPFRYGAVRPNAHGCFSWLASRTASTTEHVSHAADRSDAVGVMAYGGTEDHRGTTTGEVLPPA